jgi:LuxR family maltose regulon positive regulatory protein
MVVVDDEEFRCLPGSIAIFRAAQAQARGDVAGTMHYARRVLDLVPEDDQLRRGAAVGFLGLASWASGDLATAHRSYAECMARVQRAGYLSDVLGCAIALADISIAQGRLHEALRTYEQAVQLATGQGAPVLRGTADMYVGLGELHRERNDLDAALQHLLRSQEQGEHTGFPQYPYRWRVAMARIQAAQGDLDSAVALLDEAECRYAGDFSPNVRPVAALRTRVWVKQGRLDEALTWTGERSLSAQDDPSYLREFEHLTLARVLLAQSTRDHADRSIREAMEMMERLLTAAQDGGRTGSVIDILVVQALAHQVQGDLPAALRSLERALTLAEPEGYVRLFVDEGAPMAHLLREAATRGIMPAYTGTLLAACDAGPERSAGDASPRPTPLVAQPLSERELAMLRLLRTELSGPEIARELVVALSTVRTHTKHIYGKLNVTNRRAAVTRAAELHLL